MSSRRRTAALGLAIIALMLATLGQFHFSRREYLWDGLVFHAMAAACFLLSWRVAAPPTRRPARTAARRLAGDRRPVRALLGLGLCLSAAATLLGRDRLWNESTYDVVILWGMGIAAAIAAALWPGGEREDRPSGNRRERWAEAAAVATLALLAGILRGTALDRVPYTLAGDEAWFGLTARQVIEGTLRNPFVTAHLSMPTLFYWPMSWTLRLQDGMVGLRLPSALVGTATVPVLYLLARSLWGRRVALLAAAFLATYDYHLHYSRLGLNNAWDPLFAGLTLWLAERGLSCSDARRRTGCFILTGLVVGLGFYFYTGARLLPLLLAVYLGFSWLERRRKTPQVYGCGIGKLEAGNLVFLMVACLVVAGPIFSYAQAHPDDWNARINQVGIIQSGWLAREPGLTGKSTFLILAEQFLRAAGAFHVFPDRAVWYGADRALLGFVASILSLWGMAWAVAHWRQRRYFLVLVWFWAVILSGGMLTESPPSSQRLLMAIPPVVLLVVIGLESAVGLIGRLWPLKRPWVDLGLGLAVVAMGVGSLRFYFLEYTPSGRFGSENGETATMVGYYLRGLDGNYEAYFLGAPRIYWGFGSMSFLAPGVVGKDIEDPLTAPPEGIGRDRDVVFIFLPERVGELSWVRQVLPDGLEREFYDRSGRLRFVAWESRGQSPP